ncbi:CCR4-NOT core DEDD RNase subunit [Coniosporium tulheliwenetii]|uniref:CCR4-NOT core DEDD RNase subunit n=1 Tax=Coniosporium tulheliwenetii TaxID=3383036 RepID=A0ACC2Z5P7_9PEZI|nr:CCR4-NOT core DEDD RNase subunit [Cladosporium sp. JES 115]
MPPTAGRYHQSNPSNPFAHYNPHAIQQPSHIPQANPSLRAQNLGGHPGFAGGNVFGPGAGNGGLQGHFGGGGGLAGGGGTGLASQEAQMRFAHAPAIQQQAHDGPTPAPGAKGMGTRIREVWRNNLAQEMQMLRSLVEKYPYISMESKDTEFPGVVARPMGEFNSKASYHYQTVHTPVRADPSTLQASGAYTNNLIACPTTWTFNFQFSLESDMYNEESIQLLQKSGSDFTKHAENGIDPLEFGSLLITSGLVLTDDVHWISFHSGYDFAYLVKLMWCQPLPNDEDDYRALVSTFFPQLLDVKYLLRHAQKLHQRNALPSDAAKAVLNELGTKSALQDLADHLGCARVGTQHQAGSDAWLTGTVFWLMRAKFFEGHIPEDLNGQIAATQAAILAANQGHAAGGGQAVNGTGAGGGALGAAFQFHGREGGPSTPTTGTAGLAGTPQPGSQGQGHGMGSLTPGACLGTLAMGSEGWAFGGE